MSSLCVRAAAAALAVAGIALASISGPLPVRAQSTDDKAPDILSQGVYRIFARVFSVDRFGTFDVIRGTGIMIREPNKILTVALPYDSYENIYDIKFSSSGPYYLGTIQICEHVDVRNPANSVQEKARDQESANADLNKMRELRFAAAKKPAQDAGKKNLDDSIARNQETLNLSRACSRARVTEIDPARNLVLLEAEERLKGQAPRFSWIEPTVGSTVRAYGFPAAADRSEFMPRRSTSATQDGLRLVPSQTSGTVVKNNAGDDKEGQLVMHQAPVANGAWGGPLVNTCNEVVGLNWKPQDVATLVEAKAETRQTARNAVQAQPKNRTVATSNVMVAVGGREIMTFAELRGISLSNVTRQPCLGPGLVDNLRQNPVVLLGVVSALLLAAASLVVALRRPAIRQTLMRVSGMGRSRQVETFAPGYASAYGGSPYNAPSPQQPASDYSPYAPTAVPVVETVQAYPPASAKADPTRILTDQGDSGVKLVPIEGGAALGLNMAQLGSNGVVVGRGPECDAVIDSSTVSKRHARINLVGTKLQIDDLGSANGTFRGKTRIQRETFGNGDTVRFGSVEYRCEIAPNAGGATVMIGQPPSWMMSGFDEEGRVLQWELKPKADSSGRPVETQWIIGRNTERADKVLADKRISGEHARIRWTPQRGLEICDLGSSNGTKVDGKKITDHHVSINDAKAVEFGGSKMTLTKT